MFTSSQNLRSFQISIVPINLTSFEAIGHLTVRPIVRNHRWFIDIGIILVRAMTGGQQEDTIPFCTLRRTLKNFVIYCVE